MLSPMGHQSSRLGWFAVFDLIRSKGSQRKATWICTSQKRTMGSRIGDKIESRLFDRSRSSDRNGLSSNTWDDAVLYDTGCVYAKMDCIIVWTIRTICAFAFVNDWNIWAWKTPLKNDKYHTFEITIDYELNKPKKWKENKKKVKKMGKKTEESLNNIRIRFPTYQNECYAKRTRILCTVDCICEVA